MLIRGRSGFDVGEKARAACRGSVPPVKRTGCNLTADDFEYALAA